MPRTRPLGPTIGEVAERTGMTPDEVFYALTHGRTLRIDAKAPELTQERCTAQLATSVAPSMLDALGAAAEARGISRALWIRIALQDALDRQNRR